MKFTNLDVENQVLTLEDGKRFKVKAYMQGHCKPNHTYAKIEFRTEISFEEIKNEMPELELGDWVCSDSNGLSCCGFIIDPPSLRIATTQGTFFVSRSGIRKIEREGKEIWRASCAHHSSW